MSIYLYLTDDVDHGGADTGEEGRGVDHLDAGGEYGEAPGRGKGQGEAGEAGLAAQVEELAGQEAAHQCPNQGEAGHPGALLVADVQHAAAVEEGGRAGGVGGDVGDHHQLVRCSCCLLEGGEGGRGVALAEADGEWAEGNPQHGKDLT